MGRFDNRTRVLIGAVCLLAVAAALIALSLNVSPIGIVRDTRIESESAVGNRAFMEFLEEMGIAVDTDSSHTLPLVPIDHELRIVMANPATEDTKWFSADETGRIGPDPGAAQMAGDRRSDSPGLDIRSHRPSG